MASEALGTYMSTATNFLDRLGVEGVGIVELVQPILHKTFPLGAIAKSDSISFIASQIFYQYLSRGRQRQCPWWLDLAQQ